MAKRPGTTAARAHRLPCGAIGKAGADRRSRDEHRRMLGGCNMATERARNLQDTFLERVRQARTPLTVFLTNGVRLQGFVAGFDNFCVLLERDEQVQLVYKHAISTIVPLQQVDLH